MQNLPARTHVVNISPNAAPLNARERETTTRSCDGEESTTIFTCNRGLASRLLRRGVVPDREDRIAARPIYWWVTVPKSWVTIRPPRRSGMTQEQRRAAAERLALLKKSDHWSRTPEEKALARG